MTKKIGYLLAITSTIYLLVIGFSMDLVGMFYGIGIYMPTPQSMLYLLFAGITGLIILFLLHLNYEL